ncbi:MAG: helix-turn-helix domain-containing protein [Treponema sp.]|jgi:transcriptional regulator with XRE-family HTH domain|nr:helix-turn-helix domain-containing protein [Treponema sp.]
MTNIRDVLASNLKKFRQARGWTQSFLAEKAETSTNYIGMLENTVKFPSSEMIQKLSFALGIDPTDLFLREIDPLSTMKNYQKAALEDIYELLGRLINEKIQVLDMDGALAGMGPYGLPPKDGESSVKDRKR